MRVYVRHRMLVNGVLEIISLKQSGWSEKNIHLKTQNRNQLSSDFEIDSYKLVINAFDGKTMEKTRKRWNIKFFKKMRMKNLLNNFLNYLSVEFINLIQIMIVIHSNKKKFLWISRFI